MTSMPGPDELAQSDTTPSRAGTDPHPRLEAYHVTGRSEVAIVPGRRWRDWMEETDRRVANRCLPLLMANESAWWLLNPVGFTVSWSGGERDADVRIVLDEGAHRDPLVASMFGYGIVTWTIPYVFRTDTGWNLLARGPANWPKDGVTALEGLVETDWSTATFTMNWKLTRPDLEVRFEAGEPFCAIVPQRRYELEMFTPRLAPLSEQAELESKHRAWERARDESVIRKFLSQYGTVEGFDPNSWQLDYFRGQNVDGQLAADHQTKRRLREFSRSRGDRSTGSSAGE